MTTTDWNPILRSEFDKPYWRELQDFVTQERSQHVVYPPAEDVFSALHLTPYAEVRVVILGQDPYHGAGQAHGLAFSVRPPTPIPPSLRNMFKELESDLGISPPGHGFLQAWATQGVLLLNTSLTVRARTAGSHQKRGWETFTDEVIRAVASKAEPVVFLLWGSAARAKKKLIASTGATHHTILESPHPSPLSAHRGFFGSRPFSQTNAALEQAGQATIDWDLGDSLPVGPKPV